MIRLLKERETGILRPLALRRTESARRNFNLVLSKNVAVQQVHKGGVNSIDLDVAENRYLLSGASDSSIAITDTQTCNGHIKQLYSNICTAQNKDNNFKYGVETVQWYPVDTGLFTTSGADKQLKIWDTNRLEVVEQFDFPDVVNTHHMSKVARKHFLIAVCPKREYVKLVDVKSGSASHQLKGHEASAYAVQWSPREENVLVTGGGDGRLLLWDVRKAKGHLIAFDQYFGTKSDKRNKSRQSTTAHDGTVNSMCFTPDGLFLVSFGSDNLIRLWNTSTGQNMDVNYGLVFNPLCKTSHMDLCTSSNPEFLFVPSNSSRIQVFELFKGSHLATLSGHYSFVNCCVSHPDTQYLFSGSADRTILVWTPQLRKEDLHEHLFGERDAEQSGRRKIIQNSVLTADTWSSDEDDT